MNHVAVCDSATGTSGPAIRWTPLSSRPCLPYVGDIANGRAPSLHGHYTASSLVRSQPPPSRLRPTSRCRRLYGLPCSGDFAPGRGGLLQLLSMSLSPCRRFHPAEVNSRIGQYSAAHAAFALRRWARPSGLLFLRPQCVLFLYSTVTRVLPSVDLVDRLRRFCFHLLRYPNYGALTFTPAGLSPAEHASLTWTHLRTKNRLPNQNDYLTRKAPYRFESMSLQRRVRREPRASCAWCDE